MTHVGTIASVEMSLANSVLETVEIILQLAMLLAV
jgi:hypothetical protein